MKGIMLAKLAFQRKKNLFVNQNYLINTKKQFFFYKKHLYRNVLDVERGLLDEQECYRLIAAEMCGSEGK